MTLKKQHLLHAKPPASLLRRQVLAASKGGAQPAPDGADRDRSGSGGPQPAGVRKPSAGFPRVSVRPARAPRDTARGSGSLARPAGAMAPGASALGLRINAPPPGSLGVAGVCASRRRCC